MPVSLREDRSTPIEAQAEGPEASAQTAVSVRDDVDRQDRRRRAVLRVRDWRLARYVLSADPHEPGGWHPLSSDLLPATRGPGVN